MQTKFGRLLAATAVLTLMVATQPTPAQAQTTPWPQTPPAEICGATGLLTGPGAPPAGALTVPAGDNSSFDFNRPGATFWFAPGVHTLGTSIYGQIVARDNVSFIGGPGAVIDGQNRNLYAFTNDVSGVTIKYLTIQNFGRGADNNNEAVVNHDSGSNWTIEYNTIIHNDGAGVFLGSGNSVRFNCLKENGQYGFSMYRPQVEGDSAITDIILDHNEITGNNTDDWERRISGCGCTGAGKFWDVRGAQVTNNWIYNNRGPGLWADTNNIDFLIEGNFIDNNDGEGLFYEISYNATVRNNLFRRNAWVKGHEDQGSPAPGIYISESGGDPRLPSTISGSTGLRIYNNLFENNFSGVSIYENANRFCNSNGNTSTSYCTPFVSPTIIPEPYDYNYPNPINASHPCYTNVAQEPYRTDCRWNSQNVEVYNNDFVFDPSVVPCVGDYCGVNALYASGADNMPWSPYTVSEIQNKVMFGANNRFHDNHYSGNWRFAKGYGEQVDTQTWTSAPFNQDSGSSFNGGPPPPPAPTPVANYLDSDTSMLEGSIGQWQAWYSATISRDTKEPHGGLSSLKVNVTAPYGWGVHLANYPGFATVVGPKRITYWARRTTTGPASATLKVSWLNSARQVLRTDLVPVQLTKQWRKGLADFAAPTGTATVNLEITGPGKAGDVILFDDFVVADAP